MRLRGRTPRKERARSGSCCCAARAEARVARVPEKSELGGGGGRYQVHRSIRSEPKPIAAQNKLAGARRRRSCCRVSVPCRCACACECLSHAGRTGRGGGRATEHKSTSRWGGVWCNCNAIARTVLSALSAATQPTALPRAQQHEKAAVAECRKRGGGGGAERRSVGHSLTGTGRRDTKLSFCEAGGAEYRSAPSEPTAAPHRHRRGFRHTHSRAGARRGEATQKRTERFLICHQRIANRHRSSVQYIVVPYAHSPTGVSLAR